MNKTPLKIIISILSLVLIYACTPPSKNFTTETANGNIDGQVDNQSSIRLEVIENTPGNPIFYKDSNTAVGTNRVEYVKLKTDNSVTSFCKNLNQDIFQTSADAGGDNADANAGLCWCKWSFTKNVDGVDIPRMQYTVLSNSIDAGAAGVTGLYVYCAVPQFWGEVSNSAPVNIKIGTSPGLENGFDSAQATMKKSTFSDEMARVTNYVCFNKPKRTSLYSCTYKQNGMESASSGDFNAIGGHSWKDFGKDPLLSDILDMNGDKMKASALCMNPTVNLFTDSHSYCGDARLITDNKCEGGNGYGSGLIHPYYSYAGKNFLNIAGGDTTIACYAKPIHGFFYGYDFNNCTNGVASNYADYIINTNLSKGVYLIPIANGNAYDFKMTKFDRGNISDLNFAFNFYSTEAALFNLENSEFICSKGNYSVQNLAFADKSLATVRPFILKKSIDSANAPVEVKARNNVVQTQTGSNITTTIKETTIGYAQRAKVDTNGNISCGMTTIGSDTWQTYRLRKYYVQHPRVATTAGYFNDAQSYDIVYTIDFGHGRYKPCPYLPKSQWDQAGVSTFGNIVPFYFEDTSFLACAVPNYSWEKYQKDHATALYGIIKDASGVGYACRFLPATPNQATLNSWVGNDTFDYCDNDSCRATNLESNNDYKKYTTVIDTDNKEDPFRN